MADPTQDAAKAIARDTTIHVSERLSDYRTHLEEWKTLTDQINDVDKGAVANAVLELDTEKKKADERAKQNELKDVQHQSSLANIVGGVLNQIVTDGERVPVERLHAAGKPLDERDHALSAARRYRIRPPHESFALRHCAEHEWFVGLLGRNTRT